MKVRKPQKRERRETKDGVERVFFSFASHKRTLVFLYSFSLPEINQIPPSSFLLSR